MHTFYQIHHSDYHWTKDHLLEQVRRDPSKPVQTRRQLATDLEMCIFALIVSTAEPSNIKETMADHAWIKAMQELLHQFDRLKVWELVDKPFGKTVINLKWLWKIKKDEDNTVIRNKAQLVAKSAIAISCSPMRYSRTKHIVVRYHFIKEHLKRGIVELCFVRTEYQLADMFTKSLSQEGFEYLVGRLAKDNVVQRLKENAQRDSCCWFNITTAGTTLMRLDKVNDVAEVLKNLL
nr:retrovirus-related Pol polyprotein from transposon TNT 1-94 [Tanacetum cinerariifolium]